MSGYCLEISQDYARDLNSCLEILFKVILNSYSTVVREIDPEIIKNKGMILPMIVRM